MIVIKKSEIHTLLLHISSYVDNTLVGGLLSENITLGMKRRLQKIHKEAYPQYEEYLADRKAIEKEFEDAVALVAELKTLDEEEVKINQDKLSMTMIEQIQSKNNYDFDFLDKIAE